MNSNFHLYVDFFKFHTVNSNFHLYVDFFKFLHCEL